MNWDDARVALADGHRIRRPHWDTCLYQFMGVIQWDISEQLARACNPGRTANRTYKPWPLDTAAKDWAVAK